MNDFFIDTIAGQGAGTNQFWSLCLNYRPISVGGCQQIVKEGDQVLFAFANSFGNENPTENYLRLYGPKVARANKPVTLTVTDGKGAPVKDVTVKDTAAGITGITNVNGQVQFTLSPLSRYAFKADNGTDLVSIRSTQHFLSVG